MPATKSSKTMPKPFLKFLSMYEIGYGLKMSNILKKINSFGAKCIEIDGHDINAMRQAKNENHIGKPLIILARTSPYKGMKYLKTRFPRLHYVRFKSEEEREKMNNEISKELGISPIKY